MLTTFRYLNTQQVGEDGHGLSGEEISHVLNSLVTAGPDRTKKAPNLVALAEALYEALKSREEVIDEMRTSSLKSLITILADRSKPQEARELLAELHAMGPSLVEARQWTDILVGFARIDNQGQIIETIEMMQSRGIQYDSQVHQSLVLYYAAHKNVSRMKEWYEFGKAKRLDLPRKAQVAVLKICTEHGDLEWGEPIMRAYTDQEPSNEADRITAWGMVLRWAAAKGNGFDELDRMLQVLVQKSTEQGLKTRPEIRSINGLIAMANAKRDAYAAERYLALGQKWGLQPDERTLTLQFEYRIDSGDLDGARAVYYELKSHWPSLEELSSAVFRKYGGFQLVNRFMVKLCQRKPLKYDLIMELVADLEERHARLSPETVSALALVHLQREELHELVDLLNTHVYRFSVEQRAVVCNVMVRYCLDPFVLTAKVWDAYNILRRTFAELGREERTKIMLQFSERGRSDMATHVFGHMRHLDMPDQRPTSETYVLCFEGIAQAGDSESLVLVQNMLKLDNQVEPDTRLYNALMLAYIGIGDPEQSLRYWDDIIHSREGPTYNSIQIALRACEDAHFGERQARDIWNRLKRFEIPVTREIYAAYVGALAGQSLFDECVDLINSAEKEAGYTPDVLL